MMKKSAVLLIIFSLVSIFAFSCTNKQSNEQSNLTKTTMVSDKMNSDTNVTLDTATFGAGCFWCVEAVFQNLKGVYSVEAGYSGGTVEDPTYEAVCTGATGHAEVAQITFDPNIISFETLVNVFFHTHDPTTLNQQGADMGTQYRSAIFYHNEEQKETAEKVKGEVEAEGVWSDPIVTEITPLKNYYPAEDYHQNYYNNNSNKPYCSAVIAPKLSKFFKEFDYLLKDEVKSEK